MHIYAGRNMWNGGVEREREREERWKQDVEVFDPPNFDI